MTKEDNSHRSHKLNPRKHPRGRSYEFKGNDASDLVFQGLAGLVLLSDDEMAFIHDVPRLLDEGTYANLGHARGGSAILMADSMRENFIAGKVYSVDLFPRASDLRRAKQNIDKFQVDRWIQLCHGSTEEWAVKIEMLTGATPFNFLFIDADHTYEAVKRDFLAWGRFVKPGGWVSFHDTNQDFSHNAIEETVAELWPELKEYHVDRIRTFQRPL